MAHWSVKSVRGRKTFNVFNKECHSELLNIVFCPPFPAPELKQNLREHKLEVWRALLAWYKQWRPHVERRLFNESYSNELALQDFFDDFKIFD